MPELDGLEVCRRMRDTGDRTPVLMLTARDEVGDRVAGLDAGADDYLSKPFALEELLARLRALLRRSGWTDDARACCASPTSSSTRTPTRSGAASALIELTRTEFLLLELFLRHPRQVLTRSQIFDRVWGYDFGPASNSLEVYVGYLRRKTEAGGEPRLLHTVRGVGYVLREARHELPPARLAARRGGGRRGRGRARGSVARLRASCAHELRGQVDDSLRDAAPTRRSSPSRPAAAAGAGERAAAGPALDDGPVPSAAAARRRGRVRAGRHPRRQTCVAPRGEPRCR